MTVNLLILLGPATFWFWLGDPAIMGVLESRLESIRLSSLVMWSVALVSWAFILDISLTLAFCPSNTRFLTRSISSLCSSMAFCVDLVMAVLRYFIQRILLPSLDLCSRRIFG
ncbi:unnamed protein product [Gordionus sp. m RMFG-2023]